MVVGSTRRAVATLRQTTGKSLSEVMRIHKEIKTEGGHEKHTSISTPESISARPSNNYNYSLQIGSH